LEHWRRYYNEDIPHSGIGQIPPILLHNHGDTSGPSGLTDFVDGKLQSKTHARTNRC
jgi:hypothetical protein